MSMPLSTSSADPFPIEVTEDSSQFMVKIPARQKDRARKITGRCWNPTIQMWVYPKTLRIYEALTEEFKRDASVFDIRKPKNKRLPTPQSSPDDGDQSADEWADLNQKTSAIHEKFNGLGEQMLAVLESLRSVDALSRETRDLLKSHSPSSTTEPEQASKPPGKIDPTKRDDLKLIEKALVLLAFAATNQDQSFAKWINQYRPLFQPHAFVTETHEKLKQSISEILEEPNYESQDFVDLVQKFKTRDAIDPWENKRTGNLLFTMNQHRNRFAHPINFHEYERLSRSIIYLFNLALVWPHVASEPVEESDES